MDIVYDRCCGIDVHKQSLVACIIIGGGNCIVKKEIKSFGTMTEDIIRLKDWLKTEGIMYVAMESTGVYWKPIFNILEEDFEVVLANARHIKNVPGRKTDVQDSEWLCKLLRNGLIKGSFIPPRHIRNLRDLTRYRWKLNNNIASEKNRLQKYLEDANIKLSSVATDIFGVSGRLILKELIRGTKNEAELSKLAKGRLKEKESELEKSLKCYITDHHKVMIDLSLGHIEYMELLLTKVDVQIDDHIKRHSNRVDKVKDKGLDECNNKNSNFETKEEISCNKPADGDGCAVKPMEDNCCEVNSTSDIAENSVDNSVKVELLVDEKEDTNKQIPNIDIQKAIELLDTIPGVDKIAAKTIVAEIGTDMSKFPSAGHLASWGGVSPGNNESAGKHKSGKTTHGDIWLLAILVQCALCAARTKETYLRDKYYRLKVRLGGKKSAVAIAHKILISAFYILKDGVTYNELGMGYLSKHNEAKEVNRYKNKIEKLGYNVVILPKGST